MQLFQPIRQLLATGILLVMAGLSVSGQNCPPNIDFERGDFSGWTCYTGHVASVGGENVISFDYSGIPVLNRHTMYSSNPGDGLDEYGFFPKNCPNGSGHSVKLGNDQAGTEAEGLAYEFVVPAGANIYNLIYNYAVVFQDPAHLPTEQPRLVLEITNVTDHKQIYCSSFTFFPIGSALPGFQESTVASGNAPVWFKPWTPVSINLDGNAGKRIRLFFKTADCTFRRHFGYAYLDVNTECSDKFVGANFCPDDTSVSVVAPYGYRDYIWYNSNFTQVLGTQQTLVFTPPPPTGITLAVVLKPYEGYGCTDTLYTTLSDTLNLTAKAGPDTNSCNRSLVQLGVPPKAGWNYHWSPATGLSNPDVANPLANPDVTTTYVLSMRHNGGGCFSTDTVTVNAIALDNSLAVAGHTSWCIGSGESTILRVHPADSIQWFKDGVPIIGATQTEYRVTSTGTYYAVVFSFKGCALLTVKTPVNISTIPVVGFGVDNPRQCLLKNKFSFTNNSSNAVGEMQYKWLFGDGDTAITRDVVHSYTRAGTYKVTLIVHSNDVCADSSSVTIVVNPNVKAEFSIDPVCINLPVIPLNKTSDTGSTTVNYLWNFGNGNTSTQRNPPPQVYTAPGNYIMSLTVNTDECPVPVSTQKRFVYVDAPRTAVRYPEQIAVTNLPLSLEARPFGDRVLWTPANELNDPTSYTPVFQGAREQLYTIEIRTNSGCLTVDTQLVKINKSIEIFVPNSFTPNNDGRNDFLRPYTIGIKSVNYFRIFNRWGQLLFETSKLSPGWDGLFKGTGIETQTLVWMFEGIGVDNNTYHAKGSSILIR